MLREREPAASTLEITQGDYSRIANGEERNTDSANSGALIRQRIKNLAERQFREPAK